MPQAYKISIFLLLCVAVLSPRLFDLDTFRTPDEDRWMARTAGFTNKLAHGRLAELIQAPHPGITTQWVGALTIRYESWAVRKLPFAIGQSLLVLAIGYTFARLWGATAGIVLTLLLAFDPQLIAHTRIYAMDSLLALFLLLSLSCLLLWNKTTATRYLIYSGAASALAVLSKLPGLLIIPFAIALLTYFTLTTRKADPNVRTMDYVLRTTGIWLSSFLTTASIALPSLLLAPASVVGDFFEFSRSDAYQELHPAGSWYYIGTLAFFSTPLHVASLIALPVAWSSAKLNRTTRKHLIILLLFAALFTLQMSLGDKKGDRYLLPVFLMLDAITAVVVAMVFSAQMHKLRPAFAGRPAYAGRVTGYLPAVALAKVGALLILLLWQAVDVARLHPYALAYINPLTKPLLNERRTGWGEGLNLAAAYLNQKAGAKHLKVAVYYPNEFSHHFNGETVPAHQYEDDSVDYVILYRAMFERGDSAWETDVLNHFENRTPERVIKLNGIEYAWIYKK